MKYDILHLDLNNSKLDNLLIYPIELEIKDTTDTARSDSYLDILIELDNEGRVRTRLFDKI